MKAANQPEQSNTVRRSCVFEMWQKPVELWMVPMKEWRRPLMEWEKPICSWLKASSLKTAQDDQAGALL